MRTPEDHVTGSFPQTRLHGLVWSAVILWRMELAYEEEECLQLPNIFHTQIQCLQDDFSCCQGQSHKERKEKHFDKKETLEGGFREDELVWAWQLQQQKLTLPPHLSRIFFRKSHYHLQGNPLSSTRYRKGWMDKYESRAHRRWTVADTVSVWRNPFQPLLNVCEYMLPFLTFYNCGSLQELVAVASGSLPCPRKVPASTEIFLSLKANKWPVKDKRLAPWPAEEQIYMHLILESAHRNKGTFSWLLFSWAASIVPAMVSPTTTCSESHCKNPYLRILL